MICAVLRVPPNTAFSREIQTLRVREEAQHLEALLCSQTEDC